MNQKLLILLISVFVSFSALSDTVVCTIQSGEKKDSVALSLNDTTNNLEDGKGTENGVYDLSFYLSGECNKTKCEMGIIIDSQIREDEVGSDNLEFYRDSVTKIIFSEALTGSPDGREYSLYCYYNK